jgi:two-component system chemotaxis response regulator CheB
VPDIPISPASAVDVIGIGASAGGLGPLRQVVGGLPPDLPAAVLVVLHVAATGTSVLPDILRRSSEMEVCRAEDGLELRDGIVVVAPPDRHLVVEGQHVRLTRDVRENGHRPAIDPLLRSLARNFDGHSAGVILSGTRDDGTLGLAELKRAGGVAIVQDPEEAEYAGMPANAMAGCDVDAVLSCAEIAPALTALARGEELNIRRPPAARPAFLGGGAPLTITCPDCGGVLTEETEAGVVHFRCHVGHSYSPRSLLALHADGVERAMWTAARSLEDRAALLTSLADRARAAGNVRTAEQFAAQALAASTQSHTIRHAIAALDDSLTPDASDQKEKIA